jgi:dTDP-glucose 4,6-dehydratase
LKLLITGGAGFIGSNFVHYTLEKHPNYELVVLDKLTYAGNINNLKGMMEKITFIKGDICRKKDVQKAIKNCDVIINFSAETHVDRSIIAAGSFVKTDVLGTYMLLELSRKQGIKKYVQISTDEVYGSIERGSFKEIDPLNPSSPYSASKSGADLLALAYHKTYGLPVMITRSSNNYGPYQHPEKFIPKLILKALLNKPLPIYGDGKQVRDWLYVIDNCEAIDLILQKGRAGKIYNVGAGEEKTNIEVVKAILKMLGKPEKLITFVKDRPAHDRRYSLDCSETNQLGWKPKTRFHEGLRKTVDWYVSNKWWWKPLAAKIEELEFWKKF